MYFSTEADTCIVCSVSFNQDVWCYNLFNDHCQVHYDQLAGTLRTQTV